MVYAALVQVFIRFCLASVLVPYSHKQKSSLPTINGYLSNGLIEALIVQLLPDWTEANFPGLFLDESLVELLAQLNDLYFCGGSRQDSLHPKLAIISLLLFGRQYGRQNVLSMMSLRLSIFFVQVSGFGC